MKKKQLTAAQHEQAAYYARQLSKLLSDFSMVLYPGITSNGKLFTLLNRMQVSFTRLRQDLELEYNGAARADEHKGFIYYEEPEDN